MQDVINSKKYGQVGNWVDLGGVKRIGSGECDQNTL